MTDLRGLKQCFRSHSSTLDKIQRFKDIDLVLRYLAWEFKDAFLALRRLLAVKPTEPCFVKREFIAHLGQFSRELIFGHSTNTRI